MKRYGVRPYVTFSRGGFAAVGQAGSRYGSILFDCCTAGAAAVRRAAARAGSDTFTADM